MKIRRLMKEHYDALLSEIDMIALPVKSSGTKYRQSALYALSRLAGYAAVSLPLEGRGVQLVTTQEHLPAILQNYLT
jgi:hypothetical protein